MPKVRYRTIYVLATHNVHSPHGRPLFHREQVEVPRLFFSSPFSLSGHQLASVVRSSSMLGVFCCTQIWEGKSWVFYVNHAKKRKKKKKRRDIVAGCGNKRATVMKDHWPQCMPESCMTRHKIWRCSAIRLPNTRVRELLFLFQRSNISTYPMVSFTHVNTLVMFHKDGTVLLQERRSQ